MEPYGAIFGVLTKGFLLMSLWFNNSRRSLNIARRETVWETFVTTSQRLYKLMQPTVGQSSICPSLILHGRTEIKARALVLGEVSALSFCLLPSYHESDRRKQSHQRSS